MKDHDLEPKFFAIQDEDIQAHKLTSLDGLL